MRFYIALMFCMVVGTADAVVKCVMASGTIKHGGYENYPTAWSNNGADWSNTLGGINYIGVARCESACYCKIISPVITEWSKVTVPCSSAKECSESCASVLDMPVIYTITVPSTGEGN